MQPVKIEFTNLKIKTFFLTWTLHTTCNYRCSYCPSFCHSNTDRPYGPAEVIEFCHNLHQRALLNHFTHFTFAFSGGEPTLFPGFLDILKSLYEKNIDTTFTSNGSRSIDFWQKAAPYMNHCVWSFHPENADLDQFYKNAEFLTQYCWLNVDMMMTTEHFESNISFAEKLNTLPNIRVDFLPIQKNFGGQSDGLIDYSEQQILFLQNRPVKHKNMTGVVSEKLKKFGVFGRGPKTIYFKGPQGLVANSLDYKQLIAQDQNKFKNWNCRIGVESLIVNADGSVYRGYCHQGGQMGTIWKPEQLSNQSIKCQMDRCKCSVDIEVNKENETH